MEADLGYPDPILGTIEDDARLTCCLHELHQVSIMLLGSLAIDTYIILDHDDAGRLSVNWSMCIWNTSWEIFRLNDMQTYTFHDRC